jgi:hypothetical protein
MLYALFWVMEHTECSKTLAYKLQTPVSHPAESIQCSEQGESLKSRKFIHVKNYSGSNICSMFVSTSKCFDEQEILTTGK